MAADTHSSLAVAGELPVATVHSPEANSATAVLLLHLYGLDASSGSHAGLETCRWKRKGPGVWVGDFLSGLRQPVLSSVVNGASVLRRYRHWQGLQWATAEGLWAEPHYSTVTGASVRAGI